MRNNGTRKLIQRFLLLSVLLGCLFALSPSYGSGLLFTTCQECDNAYYSCGAQAAASLAACLNSGQHTPQYCNDRNNLDKDYCRAVYSSCLNNCTGTFPGGGSGGSSCGRGRTQCELSCRDGRVDCVNNGGETCGDDYITCLQGCCP